MKVKHGVPVEQSGYDHDVDNAWALVVVPVGLGLLGFVEPCTLGSSLAWLKYLDGQSAAMQRIHTAAFAATRSIAIGVLGAVAAVVGARFVAYQRAFWIALGVLYVCIGALYVLRLEWLFARSLGPGLSRARASGAIALGLVFGLNIPACAAPILGALIAASAGLASIGRGFVMMAIFGLALSLPLVIAVFWRGGRAHIERLGSISRRVPLWTGVVFVGLGVLSIYSALR